MVDAIDKYFAAAMRDSIAKIKTYMPETPWPVVLPKHLWDNLPDAEKQSGRYVCQQPLQPTINRVHRVRGRQPRLVIIDEMWSGDPFIDLALDAPDNPQPEKAFVMSQTGPIHPAPTEVTEEELQTDPILRYFHYTHLPEKLKAVSKPFAEQALTIVRTVPRNAERSAGLRKLLEAKDCIVRSMI